MEQLAAMMDELGSDVGQMFAAMGANPPPTLFHFTDAEAMVKIARTKSLWASLASALTDASEIAHPMKTFRNEVAGYADRFPLLVPLLLDVFDGKVNVEPLTGEFRAYVTSFSDADNAIHWSHYGRSGTGIALGLDSGRLEANGFTLFRCIYDVEAQRRLLLDILVRVNRVLETWLPRLTPDSKRIMMDTIGAMCHGYLRMAAPLFKHEAFRVENEWRLVAHTRWDEDESEPPERRAGAPEFRTTNGRIVPYMKVQYDTLPLTQVVLGHSSPIDTHEQALAVLFENNGLKSNLLVTRSAVLLRP